MLLVWELKRVVRDASRRGIRGSGMASLGKDAEESALPCESGRMVRGGLCYVMQHRVVAVHCERRDCRSGGARNIPSRLVKNGGAGGDWA